MAPKIIFALFFCRDAIFEFFSTLSRFSIFFDIIVPIFELPASRHNSDIRPISGGLRTYISRASCTRPRPWPGGGRPGPPAASARTSRRPARTGGPSRPRTWSPSACWPASAPPWTARPGGGGGGVREGGEGGRGDKTYIHQVCIGWFFFVINWQLPSIRQWHLSWVRLTMIFILE